MNAPSAMIHALDFNLMRKLLVDQCQRVHNDLTYGSQLESYSQHPDQDANPVESGKGYEIGLPNVMD